MADHPSLLITILAFFLVLGPLVLVHELGHYLVGRLFGVKADAFSIGFGKELTGWTDKRGTRWKLSALPLGGYVQFAGDMNAASMPDPGADTLSPEERARTFQSKPLWQRALIVLAGPLTNIIVAVAIFATFNMAFGRVATEAEVAGFEAKSDARAAGLQVGDRIVAIEGDEIKSATDVPDQVAYFPGRTIAVSVERDGRTVVIPVKLSTQVVRDKFGNEARIADLGVDFAAPVIGDFSEGSPAKAAGLEQGDRILAVNGAAVAGFGDVRRIVQSLPGKTVSIRFARDGREDEIAVRLGTSPAVDAQGRKLVVGLLGVRPGRILDVGPGEAVVLAVDQSIGVVKMMITGIAQIVTGERSVKELGGPIKIAKYSGEQFSLGWTEYTWFVALISINLAFINLLPIPALDGGHLAMYAAEAIRRKPLGLRSQEWAFRTGMALVLALMLFVTVNDILTLPWFG